MMKNFSVDQVDAGHIYSLMSTRESARRLGEGGEKQKN